VPASVDGLLDFNFYDYFFQREVPQEGFTNPTGTQWIRQDRDQAKDGIPSPKKKKLTNDKVSGHHLEAGTSNKGSDGKGRQKTGDCTHQQEKQ